MGNIWLKNEKPTQFPGVKNMDLGVGMMFRRFHDMEILLVDIIRLKASLDPNSCINDVKIWSHSDSLVFYNIAQKYKSLDILGKARCSSLDRIREGRNMFAHSYTGEADQFGPLWDLNKQIEGMIPMLEQVKMELSAVSRRKNNKKAADGKKELANTIRRCMSECKRDSQGRVSLADLGNVLSKAGIKCDGKLMEVCEGLGFRIYKEKGGAGSNPNTFKVYVK